MLGACWKMLGCFNPIWGQIWTNSNIGSIFYPKVG